ncbi:alpha/beta hydrolase [Sphingomonas glacialis]|uniref:Alpha/beta hydrolase n=2 Tax=Sphingomonas glacialis TaxID=658225 RepID=A0A502FUI2_9SPHN|nr:alpha/beta hydrolase [Sphingomonas glacialis]
MRAWLMTASLLAMFSAPATLPAAPHPNSGTEPKPTIVLVHGAFAGSSSWNSVIADLSRDGYPVIAAANPLRSVKGDAAYVASIVASVKGPVILVGHSYGGEVISVAAVGRSNVKALVFVAGLAPEVGESAASLGTRFPAGTLNETLAPPVPLPDGNNDLYIDQTRYWKQFAADVPQNDARGMAVTQRPVTQAALGEPVAALSWRNVPSWFVWGSLDRNIPAALHAYMAERAKAREALEVPGASHVVMISHPHEVAAMIERAATTR